MNNIFYLTYRDKLLLFVSLLFSTLSFSQLKIDDEKRKNFYALKNEYEFSVNFSNEIGEKMIAFAQDDYEKSMAYVILGENYYNKSDFLNAVHHLEKSLNFIKKTDSLDFKVRVLNVLVISYRRAGLTSESDENWKLLKKISSQLPSLHNEANLLYTQTKIFDIDEDYCNAVITRRKYYDLTKDTEPDLEIRSRFNFAILTQLAYELIKCGKYADAQKVVKECDVVKDDIKSNDPILLYEFHLMNKALFFVKKDEAESAKLLFDEALVFNKKDNNKTIKRVLLTERVNANIDSSDDQLSFLKEISDIDNSEKIITKSLTAKETERKIQIIEEKQKRVRLLIITLAVLFFITLGFIIYFIKRSRNLRNKYQVIINELSTKSQIEDEIGSSNFEKTELTYEVCDKDLGDEVVVKNQLQISVDTEQEILKNLELFERKKLYTTKGLSATQMAVMLKTNTKYLSVVLKKFRNNDFYNYINEQRISYIVQLIYENRKYLNYKIAVLSDMCGYNTHSQFASAFKQIKGMSPSKFIQFLKEENHNLIKNS